MRFEALPKFALTVVEEGTGTGGVVSESSGIECPTTCSQEFYEGQKVNFTAKENTGSELGKWTGCEVEPSKNVCETSISKATEI